MTKLTLNKLILNKLLFSCFLLLNFYVSNEVRAAIDAYDFHGDAALEQRFRTTVEELRCPKCQNANIAGSNAPLAKDIKDRVYKMMVEEGKSDEQILAWAEQRYGTFITYRPPLTSTTLLLWFGPFIAFVLAIFILVIRIRRKKSQTPLPAQLSTEEKQEIDKLLQQYRNLSEK